MKIINWVMAVLSILPTWCVVFIIAMLPFVELRAAIPVAILVYRLPIAVAVLISVAGNLVPIIPILLLLERVEKFLRRWRFWRSFFDKLYARTRKRAGPKIEKYEELGIIFFVAVPLPTTGAWTGALIAYLFGLDIKKSFFCITAGVIIAAIIVTALVLLV